MFLRARQDAPSSPAFATGSSWGTFGIMLPMAVPVALTLGLSPTPFIAAVLSGGIVGDHASPISDTTIVSSLASASDHIEHVRDVAGIDHVGIGSDFDGISSTPVGLEDVSTYPTLLAELSYRGWSESDLRKLVGENVLRAWGEAEDAARRIQRLRAPSTATIEDLDGGRE